MKSLFDEAAERRRKEFAPLADRMRPRTLDEVVGQEDLTRAGSPFRILVESGSIPSIIFWGPPGSGKTTMAKCLAHMSGYEYIELSAVNAGMAEVRKVVKEAEDRLGMNGRRTLLFIDEIHRFNKAQQDAFLPWIENGTIVFVGATTENPSFEVNAALLSRCRVFVVKKLEPPDICQVLDRALTDAVRGLGARKPQVPDEVLADISVLADGDARVALNALEMAVNAAPGGKPTREHLKQVLQRTNFLYDKNGEEHYNIISALHKSMRGSDADASLYWLGRMLESGDDPLYVARRLVRFAAEDIGVADPQALILATSAFQAAHQIGMPECSVILAETVIYLAKAPKSNAAYAAYQAVQRDIRELPNEPVPLHLRNAPTSLMKGLGYGKGYIYNPEAEGPVDQSYLPDKLKGRRYLGP